jgi:hypothetical protein
MQAQLSGDAAKISAAQKGLEDIRAEVALAKTRVLPMLPTTPTEGYATEGKAFKK